MTMSPLAEVARIIAPFGASGLARTWRRLRGSAGRAMILMYHRVSNETDYLGLSVAPDAFSRQMQALRRSTRVEPLVELVERLARPEPMAHDVVAITFDDGYRDNLEHAAPILRSLRLPATVFVSVGFVERTAWPAGERLARAFAELWRSKVPPDAWHGDDGLATRVRSALARPGTMEELVLLRQLLKQLPEGGEHVLSALEDLAGSRTRDDRLMLDWDGVRALSAAGIEVASHAVSHKILATIGRADAEEEIRSSKARLESEIGRSVAGFAFPNGHAGDFLPEHLAMLRHAGYAYACTGETGYNLPGADPYRLKRIGVGRDSPELLLLKLAIGRAA